MIIGINYCLLGYLCALIAGPVLGRDQHPGIETLVPDFVHPLSYRNYPILDVLYCCLILTAGLAGGGCDVLENFRKFLKYAMPNLTVQAFVFENRTVL